MFKRVDVPQVNLEESTLVPELMSISGLNPFLKYISASEIYNSHIAYRSSNTKSYY